MSLFAGLMRLVPVNRVARLIVKAGSALAVAASIAACTTLPPRSPVVPSHAYTDTQSTTLAGIAQRSRANSGADTTGPSGFRLLPNGELAFQARTTLAAYAERSLDAQYYHIHNDPAGVTFLRELRDASLRGVRVRLLVDDYHAGPIYELLRGLAAHAQVEVRLFNPLLARYGTPLSRMLKSWREFDRVNHRMHNKLFVADNAVAIYGGRNVADEYFMRSGVANFVDLDLLSTGAVVPELSKAFDQYWNSPQVYPLFEVLAAPPDLQAARQAFDRSVRAVPLDLSPPLVDALQQLSIATQLKAGHLPLQYGTATVHADPPSKVFQSTRVPEPSAAMSSQLAVIAAARKQVTIVSPYLVPGPIGMRMMENAARQGVRVTLFTNSLGSTDEPLVHDAYSRYRLDMLKLGAALHEFSPTLLRASGGFGNFGESVGRLHVKASVVDGRWFLVGSVNLDGRSAVVNTEMAVVIDSPAVASYAMQLLNADGLRSMYRLRLTADQNGIEWVSADEHGVITSTPTEPHDHWLIRLKLWFQRHFVTEELL